MNGTGFGPMVAYAKQHGLSHAQRRALERPAKDETPAALPASHIAPAPGDHERPWWWLNGTECRRIATKAIASFVAFEAARQVRNEFLCPGTDSWAGLLAAYTPFIAAVTAHHLAGNVTIDKKAPETGAATQPAERIAPPGVHIRKVKVT